MPENRHDSSSRLIALPVKRIRALSPHPREPVFRLQGGPGLTNMDFPDASRYAANRDVVLVGYRGVDGSSVLDCPEVESAMKHARDLLGRPTSNTAGRLRTAPSACGRRRRPRRLLLPQRVDDLEAPGSRSATAGSTCSARAPAPARRMIYAWRYPKSIHRSVLVGVNPPGNFIWYPELTDEQVRKYAALCAPTSPAAATSDLAATSAAPRGTIPDRWGFLRIKPGNARVGAFFGLFHSTEAASPISAPQTIDGGSPRPRATRAGSGCCRRWPARFSRRCR